MWAHAFHPSTGEVEASKDLCEFKLRNCRVILHSNSVCAHTCMHTNDCPTFQQSSKSYETQDSDFIGPCTSTSHMEKTTQKYHMPNIVSECSKSNRQKIVTLYLSILIT